MTCLVKNFKINPELKTVRLNLWHQKIDCDALSQSLSRCSELTSLNIDLSRATLSDDMIPSLTSFFANTKNLHTIFIDLSFNNIGEQGILAMAAAFKSAPSLTNIILNLSSNHLRDNSMLLFITEIAKCKMLRKINLNLQQATQNKKYCLHEYSNQDWEGG